MPSLLLRTILVFGALSANTVFATEPPLGLLEVYELGLTRDTTLWIAEAQLRADREAMPIARAGLLPSVNVNGAYTQTDARRLSAAFPDGNRYDWYQYGASVTQPLFHMDRIEAYRQSKSLDVQADGRYEAALQEFRLRSTQTYIDVLSASDNLVLARVEKDAAATQFKAASQALDAGMATINDVSDARARLDLAASRELAAQNDVAFARQNLERMIGPIVNDLAALAADIPLPDPIPADIDAWTQKALQHNPQLKIADAGAIAAAFEVERNKGSNLPTLDLVANYGVSNQASRGAGYHWDNAQLDLQLQIAVPLFSGGLTSARIRVSKAQQDRATRIVEDTRRLIVAQSRQAYLNVINGKARIQATQQAVNSSREALDATQVGLEAGVRTALDVLNAQQQYFTAKRDLTGARYQFLMNHFRLKFAAGELSDDDIRLADKWFVR